MNLSTPSASRSKQRLRAMAGALLCALLWGSAYPVIKLCYIQFDVPSGDLSGKMLLAGLRFAGAGAALLLIAAFTRRPLRPQRAALPDIAWLALLQTFIQYSLNYAGLAHTTGAKAAVLNQLSTFLLVLLGAMFYADSRLTPRKLFGCIIGFLGILLANLDEGLSLRMTFGGEGLVMLSSVAASGGYLISKRAGGRADALVVTGYQQFLGGLALLAVGFLGGGQLGPATWAGIACLVHLVVVSAVSYPLWMLLLQRNPIAEVSVYKFAVPLFGTACSALMLGENPWTLGNLLSAALVAVGIAVVNGMHRPKALGAAV